MRLIPLLVATTALAGCTVGPNFTRPAAPSTSTYLSPAEGQGQNTGAPVANLGNGPALRWWTAFGSPELDALVERAMANNRSLAASNATLAAARDELRAVTGRRLPQIDANARVDQQQVNLAGFGFSGNSPLTAGGNPEFHLYSVGGGISYDLDLFGGLRRQVEQSAAQAEAQQRQAEAAHLSIAGQVVNQVLTVAALRAQIATANALLGEDLRNVDLTQKRRQGGEGTLVEVLNAQSQYAADRGDLPQLEQQLAALRRQSWARPSSILHGSPYRCRCRSRFRPSLSIAGRISCRPRLICMLRQPVWASLPPGCTRISRWARRLRKGRQGSTTS